MEQRDTYVDIAKGICMLFIICYHTEGFGVVGMILPFFAVPMYFFMSGFYDHSERPWHQWIGKSVRTLIFPAFLWCIIGTIYKNLLLYVKSGNLDLSFDVYHPCADNGPAWFLLSLFYLKVIVGSLVRLRIPHYIIIVACFVLGYFGSEYQMPLNIDESFAAVPLYYMGKILYPKIKEIMDKKWIAIFGCVMLAIYYLTPYYYSIGPRNPLFAPNYLLSIAGIFFVFLFVLWISRLLVNVKFLQAYGKHTLGIMLTHSLMCHTAAVVLNRVFEKGTTVWIVCFLLAYIIIVVLSYYLTLFMEKNCPFVFGIKNEGRPITLFR